MTTELLGFGELNYNVVYAQMGRGKTERIVASAIANIAATLSKLSMDACLFLNQNFGFIGFPAELTTGSSIMPHKKNPDVFELIRARCNQLQSLPNDIALSTANLPSGYHRDMQLLKEMLFPAFAHLTDCLSMARLMLSQVQVKENILDDDKYRFLFSVETVNKLVLDVLRFATHIKKLEWISSKATIHPGAISIIHTKGVLETCVWIKSQSQWTVSSAVLNLTKLRRTGKTCSISASLKILLFRRRCSFIIFGVPWNI